MKVLIFVSCILAAASAGFLGPAAYSAGHVPVLDHNGYQVDTADVAHAKAAHFAAHAEATARLGYGVYAPHAVAAPLAYSGYYAGAQHIPVIGPNGVPVDTPEVAAGKAANAVAHVEAKARNGDLAVVAPVAHAAYGYAAPAAAYGYAAPVVAHGVPLDTPEVAHAKVAHAAAHLEAKARNGVLAPFVHYRKRRGVLGATYAAPLAYSGLAAHSVYAAPLAYAGPQHIPTIGANGVPVDTPEVAAGKVANAVAHAEAHARNGDYAVAAPVAYSGLAAHGVYAAPLAYSGYYAGAQHIPTIGPNGVPLDTPEVAAGKVANAVAHAEAKARNGDYAVVAPVAAYSGLAHGVVAPYAHAYAAQHVPVIGPNGVPLDTPEVAAGKIANAVAHVEAKARNGVFHY